MTAAVATQRAMAEHAWPDAHDVRIRIGLHTGDITLTETGYVGLTVHAAARIMAPHTAAKYLVPDYGRSVRVPSATTSRSRV